MSKTELVTVSTDFVFLAGIFAGSLVTILMMMIAAYLSKENKD